MDSSSDRIARVACGIALWGLALVGCASPLPPEEARARVNEVLAGHDTRNSLDGLLGTTPRACTQSAPGREVCTWRLGDRQRGWPPMARALSTRMRINVVCELPSDGAARAPGSCTGYPAERGMVRAQGGTLAERRAKEARWQGEAQQTIDEAQTFWQLVDLVGSGPDSCQAMSEGMRDCHWFLDSATPGFLTVARWVGERKRLRLSCELPADDAPRAPGSCTAR